MTVKSIYILDKRVELTAQQEEKSNNNDEKKKKKKKNRSDSNSLSLFIYVSPHLKLYKPPVLLSQPVIIYELSSGPSPSEDLYE